MVFFLFSLPPIFSSFFFLFFSKLRFPRKGADHFTHRAIDYVGVKKTRRTNSNERTTFDVRTRRFPIIGNKSVERLESEISMESHWFLRRKKERERDERKRRRRSNSWRARKKRKPDSKKQRRIFHFDETFATRWIREDKRRRETCCVRAPRKIISALHTYPRWGDFARVEYRGGIIYRPDSRPQPRDSPPLVAVV